MNQSTGKEPTDGKPSRWVRELEKMSERAASYLHRKFPRVWRKKVRTAQNVWNSSNDITTFVFT